MEQILYSKYSNERSRRFAVRTDILEDKGERFVRKTPLYPQGEGHVEALVRWDRELRTLYEKAGLTCNRCEKEGKSVRLEYLSGKTLEEVLDDLMEKGETQEAEERFTSYLKQIRDCHSQEPFFMTREFEQVFGKVTLPQGLTAAPVTNIDLVCGNLVLGEQDTVLDYEWTFDFPIPCEFVLYRVIHYYVETHSVRAVLPKEKFYRQMGITEEHKKVFLEMEAAFQRYITGSHIPMRDLFAGMTPGVETVQTVNGGSLQVFFSDGAGYSEEQSVVLPMNEGRADCRVELPAGCKKIRIDPGERPCSVKLTRVEFDGKKASLDGAVVPEGILCGGWAYIAKRDPNIADISVPEGARELSLELTVYPAEEEDLKHTVQELCRLSAKVEKQAKLIREMKNTRVWKLYQSYRNKVERKK